MLKSARLGIQGTIFLTTFLGHHFPSCRVVLSAVDSFPDQRCSDILNTGLPTYITNTCALLGKMSV